MKQKILMACMGVLVFTLLTTSASAVPPPLDRLPGQRINIVTAEGTEFKTGETTHVVHGWSIAWSNLTRKQKVEFVLTAQFYLYVNGEHIYLLRSALWYDRDADDMHSLRYIVFDPYTFDPGTYEFRGVWYREENGVPQIYENTVTVTVLA